MKVFSGTKTPIVIEIGNDWLKIVEGRVSADGVVISDGSFTKLSKIRNPVDETISDIFKSKRWSKKNIISYLPRHLVTLRTLELPSVNPAEIDNIVNLHIGKQTPYSKEEIVYSYKTGASDKKGYTHVVLVIARRNLIDERMDIMAKASVSPQKMGLGSEGVARWFKAFYAGELRLTGSQAVVALDVDSNFSDFIVIHQGNLRFSKNILIGANHLIGDKDACIGQFIDEAGRALQAFREESNNIEVVKIFLSGAAKNIENLDKLVSDGLNLPCKAVDTLKNAVNAGKRTSIAADTEFISLSPALGMLAKYKELAFDLMPQEKRLGQMMEEKRKNLIVTGILFSAIILALSILLAVTVNNKYVYIDKLKQKIASIKSVSDEVDQMRLSVDLVRERMDAGGDVLNLLNEVYKAIPPQVYLTSLDLEYRGQIVLKGHAAAISDVFKFVTSLSSSAFLENVKSVYATTKEENNNPYTDFEITGQYKTTGGK